MRQSRGVADALVVLALMVAILSILDDTFADRSYLVAGLVPVVVLLGMAIVARHVDEGVWWYSLGALVVSTPLGAWAALREPGPFLLPSARTIGRVLAESIHAPTTLVGTVPPVEPNGAVMLVPFLIGLFAAFPAAWLAVATARPVAPMLPIVAAFAVTIPLGVLVPSHMALRGVLVGTLLFGWSSARARRGEGPRGGLARRSGLPVAAATLTVLVVSGLAHVVAPDADVSDRALLRGEKTPFVDSPSVWPRLKSDDIRLFTAKGVPKGRRVRLAVLDHYDGAGWVPAQEAPGSDGYGTYKRIGNDLAVLHPGATVVVRVRMRPGYDSDWLPMLGELLRIDFDWNPGRSDVSDVRYNQATSSALVLGGVDVRDVYTFESVLSKDSFTRRDRTRDPTDEQRQAAGAFLDEHLEAFDRDVLLPLERVLLLARYLRTVGVVRTTEDFDQSSTALGHRMLGSRRMTGTRFQYSALMALGASRLGVAARVVVGAEPGRRGLVEYGDLTSWVELQFADGTWRPLDPERYLGSHLAEDTTPAAATDPDEFVRDQLQQAAKGRDREIRPPADAQDGTSRRRPAWQSLLLGLGAVGAIALLGLLLVPLAKVLRRRRRRRTSSWSGIYVNGWQEILDAARDCGRPVPGGWGRVAQATALGVGLDVARRADAAVFASSRPSDDAPEEFWSACQGLRREIVGSVAGWRRRWWAHVNPASLVAGWARHRDGRPSSSREIGHEDRRTRRQHAAGA